MHHTKELYLNKGFDTETSEAFSSLKKFHTIIKNMRRADSNGPHLTSAGNKKLKQIFINKSSLSPTDYFESGNTQK